MNTVSSKPNILYAEDDFDDFESLKEALDQISQHQLLLHAKNGQEAISFIENATVLPSLIVLDLNMPIMDGFEVLNALSADQRLSRIPVCVLSTSSDESDMQRAKELGARAYMVKPPTLQQLEDALEGVDTLELLPRGDALVLFAEQN